MNTATPRQRAFSLALCGRRLIVAASLCLCVAFLPLPALSQDSTTVEQPKKREMSWLRRTIRGFSYIDENYVEPQHYNWAVMAQGTYNYDYYRLSATGASKQSVTFTPAPTFKFGPYFGWRWVFLGYTIDLKRVDVANKERKQELDFSIYSAQVGADLYYRRTGSDYRIRRANLGSDVDTEPLKSVNFDGLGVGITGFNVYYIFNHQRFSYPAAFAQSTMQKISCGSWMAGFGYLRNSLDFDYDKMQALVNDKLGREVPLDSGLMFNSVKYTDISLSGGYAYNWVFAPDFLFCSSLSLALGYKKSRGETADEGKEGFDIGNFNLDGIGRFGLVYNNMRWYAGASVIVRAYNYHKSRFATNNVFGSMNIYVGYNFGARGKYKKKKN
ncbi:MAG: DUF4421 domain-containing protein [Prevotella sp.]|nr:DUF4421 domain-containing protein [Prevotella sp.]